MTQQVTLGLLAAGIGMIVGVGLFVPFVALSYRRRGRLSFGRMLLWAAALVYFWAIWTYTLLPLPDPETMSCAGVNLNVAAFVGDIREALAAPGNPLTHPSMLQLALNVLLFVPLGGFLRILGGRGILTAVVVGLGVSLLIETTQLTGVWGLYPCAYRVFDVDDLLTNTLGAAAGSILALIVPRRLRGRPREEEADRPRPVTRSRRLLAMVCDVLSAALSASAIAVLIQLLLRALGADPADTGGIAVEISSAAVIIAVVVFVLVTGRSLGDVAVELRYVGGPLPEPIARFLRCLGGIGGYLLLQWLPAPSSLMLTLFVLANIVMVFTTDQGRGLPGIISGRRLVDARDVDGGIAPSQDRDA